MARLKKASKVYHPGHIQTTSCLWVGIGKDQDVVKHTYDRSGNLQSSLTPPKKFIVEFEFFSYTTIK